jgi:hypothetical protein|tara:strand:- start:2585 stop:2947 length:363 start_codon:yes stop_codon:yes gene_type:complete
MSLANAIHDGVAVAHSVTNDGGLQATFTHEAATTTRDRQGRPTYGTAVSRTGLLYEKSAKVLDSMGNEKVSSTQLVVLGTTAFDEKDKITLPGSVIRPIIKAEAMVDSANDPYVTVLYFG